MNPAAPMGDPFRLHVRLFRSEPLTFGAAHFEILGPSTVTAEDLVGPSGQVERVGLTACAQEVVAGLRYECTRRVPLEIRVVPCAVLRRHDPPAATTPPRVGMRRRCPTRSRFALRRPFARMIAETLVR